MRALFPKDNTRRAFLTAVGASTALAAVAQFLPIGAATDAFAQGGTLEKKDLEKEVGFIPITCATPVIMAAPMGFYTKQGLNVEVVKTAGWAVIRDKTHRGAMGEPAMQNTDMRASLRASGQCDRAVRRLAITSGRFIRSPRRRGREAAGSSMPGSGEPGGLLRTKIRPAARRADLLGAAPWKRRTNLVAALRYSASRSGP